MTSIRFVQADTAGKITGTPLAQIKQEAQAAAQGKADASTVTALDTRVTSLEKRPIPSGDGGTVQPYDDTALRGQITAEATAREAGDSALSDRVDVLEAKPQPTPYDDTVLSGRVSAVESSLSSKADVAALGQKADASTVTALSQKVDANTTAVAQNATAIKANADALAARVPIFTATADAKAWEAANPGKVALVYDSSSNVTPAPDPKATWTPAAPSKTTTSYTIPTDAGATYTVNGTTTAAGTYTATIPSTVAIKAVPAAGYTFAATATTSWSYTFEQSTPAYDTAALAPSPAFYFRMDDATGSVPKNRGTVTPQWQTNSSKVITMGQPGNGVGATSAKNQLWMTNWVTAPPAALTIATVVTPAENQNITLGSGNSQLSNGLLKLSTFTQANRAGSLLQIWGTAQANKVESDQPTLLPAKPVHVALTWDGATFTAYVDGKAVATKADATAYPASSAYDIPVVAPNENFSGVVIDTKAWSAGQVKALSDSVVRS